MEAQWKKEQQEGTEEGASKRTGNEECDKEGDADEARGSVEEQISAECGRAIAG